MDNPPARDIDTGRSRIQRYVAITLVATPANFIAYITILSSTDWRAWICNMVAATSLAPPTFVAYRRWAWRLTGRASLRCEVLPYWIFTVFNVAAASSTVALLQALGANERVLWMVPLCVYTLVWVVRYPMLNVLLNRAKPHVLPT